MSDDAPVRQSLYVQYENTLYEVFKGAENFFLCPPHVKPTKETTVKPVIPEDMRNNYEEFDILFKNIIRHYNQTHTSNCTRFFKSWLAESDNSKENTHKVDDPDYDQGLNEYLNFSNGFIGEGEFSPNAKRTEGKLFAIIMWYGGPQWPEILNVREN